MAQRILYEITITQPDGEVKTTRVTLNHAGELDVYLNRYAKTYGDFGQRARVTYKYVDTLVDDRVPRSVYSRAGHGTSKGIVRSESRGHRDD